MVRLLQNKMARQKQLLRSRSGQKRPEVVILPREVINIPWGSSTGAVGYRTVQADGRVGPSTIAVTEDLVYIVDRINSEIKICGLGGSRCEPTAHVHKESHAPLHSSLNWTVMMKRK